MTKRVKRQAEAVPAARDKAEATTMVARIGELQRKQQAIAASLADAIAKAKEDAATLAKQLAAEEADLTRGVQMWAEANRAALTQEGKTKTVTLLSGKLEWRLPPPKVTIRGEDTVLAALDLRKYRKFRRIKIEINKQAMLDDPKLATTINGVSIGNGAEEFCITPTEAPALAGAA